MGSTLASKSIEKHLNDLKVKPFAHMRYVERGTFLSESDVTLRRTRPAGNCW